MRTRQAATRTSIARAQRPARRMGDDRPMNPTLFALLLFVHVAGAVFWVGGMATMHLVVRPAAVAALEPPQRLRFMAAALTRFLRGVDLALAALWISGMAMFMAVGGFRGAHWRIHAMFTLALLMTLIYAFIRARAFPALRTAVAAEQWPQAGAALGRVRQLVALNLGLGTLVFAVALVGRAG
jgi:uncharacterized membrane protein